MALHNGWVQVILFANSGRDAFDWYAAVEGY